MFRIYRESKIYIYICKLAVRANKRSISLGAVVECLRITVSRLVVIVCRFFNMILLFCRVEEGIHSPLPKTYPSRSSMIFAKRIYYIKSGPRRQRFYLYNLKLSETNFEFGPPCFLQPNNFSW